MLAAFAPRRVSQPMPELPPYSVVVPVYNGARYVRRAVDSAIAQAVPPAEVIVVDDASTDGSGDLVAAVDPSVRVLRHAVNRGLAAARNTGIAAVTTEIVALLDSDDTWHPEKMARQLPAFARPDVALAFCDFRRVDAAGTPVGRPGGTRARLVGQGLTFEPCGDGVELLIGSVVEALIRETSFIHPSSLVARKSAFAAAGGPFDESYRHGEDLEMWLRLAATGRVAYADAELVDIEVRPDSLGHQVVKAATYLTRLYATLPARYPDMTPATSRAIRDFLRREYAGLAWHHREAGDRAQARDYYRKSLAAGWSTRTLVAYLQSLVR